MDISNVFMVAVSNAALLHAKRAGGEGKTALFQSLMEEMQIKADILEHMKGIPSDAVYIAPNMLQKMKEDPSAYNFYMEQLDYFVGEYKRCNLPGVMEMSFYIRADGQYGIRAENIFLKRQCEAAGGVDPEEDEGPTLEELWKDQPYFQLNDASMLSLCLAGAYAAAGEWLRISNAGALEE